MYTPGERRCNMLCATGLPAEVAASRVLGAKPTENKGERGRETKMPLSRTSRRKTSEEIGTNRDPAQVNQPAARAGNPPATGGRGPDGVENRFFFRVRSRTISSLGPQSAISRFRPHPLTTIFIRRCGVVVERQDLASRYVFLCLPCVAGNNDGQGRESES